MNKIPNLKKILWKCYNVLVFVIAIGLTGLLANLIIYFFHSIILGWGDSGPDWYIDIQEWVIYGVFLASAMLWLGGAYWLRLRNKSRENINPPPGR